MIKLGPYSDKVRSLSKGRGALSGEHGARGRAQPSGRGLHWLQ